MSAVPNVLSIAGSDPGGGAGIQGDVKTFAALGVWGCAVPTALTAQNTRGVRAVLPVPADFVAEQLEVLFDDVEVHAVKVGMLGGADVVRAVAAALRRHRPPHVVLDPVLRASAGGVLLDAAGLDALRDELLPLAALVTPNAAEAGALLGAAPPRTETEAAEAARALLERGVGAALVTGGHLEEDGATCADVLAAGGAVTTFRTPRAAGGTHGTGCALSSAVAALLARGHPLVDACRAAQACVADAVRAGGELRAGRGVGPIYLRPPAPHAPSR
jgi:hydroxymethylpyrimidine/phosphomethylpyrimidine kinase